MNSNTNTNTNTDRSPSVEAQQDDARRQFDAGEILTSVPSRVQDAAGNLKEKAEALPAQLEDVAGEELLDEFSLGRDSFERGLPMSVGFKMLIVCISVVLFAVIEMLVSSLLITKESISAIIANETATVASSVFIILMFASIVGILFIIYLLVLFFSKKHEKSWYCKFYKRRGLPILLAFFFVVAGCVAYVLLLFTDYHKIVIIATFIAAFIAFIPIAIAWNVEEEDRLKNFIDGFSKACSCMAFMGGAIALLFKTFIS